MWQSKLFIQNVYDGFTPVNSNVMGQMFTLNRAFRVSINYVGSVSKDTNIYLS